MAGLADYSAKKVLELLVGKTAFATPTAYVALFTATGTDAGSGFTEVSGGSYARVATSGATWGSASGSAPSLITNAAAITFPQATASWSTITAFGIYDAPTAGNLIAWDFLGNNPWYPFSCTLASPGVLTAIGITAGSTSFANGSIVEVDAEFGGALPTGLAVNTSYTVAGLSADTFNVGTNTTSTGSGMVRQVNSQAIAINVTFSFGIGTLTLSQA